MKKSYALYLGEWIRICTNARPCGGTACSGCGKVKRTLVWRSIKTREVRCLKCFDAEAEHWRQENARWDAEAAERRRRRLEARP
jgi:hypothetical protein